MRVDSFKDGNFCQFSHVFFVTGKIEIYVFIKILEKNSHFVYKNSKPTRNFKKFNSFSFDLIFFIVKLN